jgi:hypothetical protein
LETAAEVRVLDFGYTQRRFVGFTRRLSQTKRRKPRDRKARQTESVVEFMRCENINANQRPWDIRITYSAWGNDALRIPHYTDPRLSIAQEPSIVRLPDKRLFAVMSSMPGYAWYSLSGDNGYTWASPRPLLSRDHGQPILLPVNCRPMYEISPGRYYLAAQ